MEALERSSALFTKHHDPRTSGNIIPFDNSVQNFSKGGGRMSVFLNRAHMCGSQKILGV